MSFEGHVFHQIVPSDDDDDAVVAEGSSHDTQISSHHTEVFSSTKDQGSSSEGEVIEHLVKEMQTQSPSIYTSVKNLIAYLVGNELSLGTYSSTQDIMLFGKCLLQAIQAHELLSYGDFVLQHPQRDGESGMDRLDVLCRYKVVYQLHAGARKADGKVSRLFGRSFFLWSRCWPQVKASTIELIQAMNTVDPDEVEIFLSVYEKTLNDSSAIATEEEELIWAENFSEVLRNRQKLRYQVVAGRIADKAENDDDDDDGL